jgi:hypothetical protein
MSKPKVLENYPVETRKALFEALRGEFEGTADSASDKKPVLGITTADIKKWAEENQPKNNDTNGKV